MKRTRKWIYVAQEATRLAELGLGSTAIARQLGVDLSTVTRWFQSGKLKRQRRVATVSAEALSSVTNDARDTSGVLGGATKSPAAWAASVRAEYSLSETDAQLVTLGETALTIARSPTESASAVLAAIRTFLGVAKQLALVAKVVEVAADQPAEQPQVRVLRPTGADPRVGLMVVHGGA